MEITANYQENKRNPLDWENIIVSTEIQYRERPESKQ
jgi:hypothetical protein